MSDQTTQLPELNLELPAAAPSVRITAGIGSAAQKTWNIRRPITLIGSRRPAHIVLHDQGVNRAHCVIVNTGTEILIKDLHTSEGTFCNKNRVELAILGDGDIITVGETRIQIAIQSQSKSSDDSGYGAEVEDPLAFSEPVVVRQANTERQWRIEEAVVLIGRHEGSFISLDHEDVSARHAVIFRFMDRPAIFDLGSRTGLIVNNERSGTVRLRDGSQLIIGPFTLSVGSSIAATPSAPPAKPAPPVVEPATPPPAPSAANEISIPTGPKPTAPKPTSPFASLTAPPSPKPTTSNEILVAPAGADPIRSLAQIESELTGLQKGLSDSWERLNSWQSRLMADANALNKHEHDLAAREADLDAKDAEYRGQLHDLTRFQEQLAARERELSEQLAQLRSQQEAASSLEATCAQRDAELAKRTEELQRREHVFAQRWNRLMSAKCAHCGKPVEPPK